MMNMQISNVWDRHEPQGTRSARSWVDSWTPAWLQKGTSVASHTCRYVHSFKNRRGSEAVGEEGWRQENSC